MVHSDIDYKNMSDEFIEFIRTVTTTGKKILFKINRNIDFKKNGIAPLKEFSEKEIALMKELFVIFDKR